jgi:uncharacterized protein YcbK (DUF882 family)
MKSAKAWLLAIGLAGALSAQADERDLRRFAAWAGDHETGAFRQMLVQARLYGVVPIHQLLRSASDWRKCRAEPFAVPPASQWPAVRSTVALLKVLGEQGVLREYEVVSAYRDGPLNRCAGGVPGSAHLRAFAVDLLLAPGADATRLCQFWLRHGQAWNMGLGRYPSGRIHIDTAGYRTWGGATFCPRPS